jgi:lipopolysaccharide export system protein LptA
MSTPRSRLATARIEVLLLAIAALTACGVAQARQSDKSQPVNLNADHLKGSQENGKLVVTGNVTLDQGTFHADGAQATGYTDPNDSSQWQRVVLTGSPAHFRQTRDSGKLVHGQAQKLDYKISENTVILTGDASVTQEGRGSFKGARLTYNTDTGAIEGAAAAGGRVHITLQPRSKPAPTGAPASAAPAASAINPAPSPASTKGTSPGSAATDATTPSQPAQVPAPASTTGIH